MKNTFDIQNYRVSYLFMTKTEEFSSETFLKPNGEYETFDFTIRYFLNSDLIRSIFICTWSGGWEHKMKSISIEYDHINTNEHRFSIGIGQHSVSKDGIIPAIIDYIGGVSPELVINWNRNNKLNQLI